LLPISTTSSPFFPQQQPQTGPKDTSKRAGELTEEGARKWRKSESCPHIAGSITANTSLNLHCGLDYHVAPVMRVTLCAPSGQATAKWGKVMQRSLVGNLVEGKWR